MSLAGCIPDFPVIMPQFVIGLSFSLFFNHIFQFHRIEVPFLFFHIDPLYSELKEEDLSMVKLSYHVLSSYGCD